MDIIGIDQNGYPKKYYLARAKIYNIHNHVLKLTRKLASEQILDNTYSTYQYNKNSNIMSRLLSLNLI